MTHDNTCTNSFIALKLSHIKANNVIHLFRTEQQGRFICSPLFQRTTGFIRQSRNLNFSVLIGKRSKCNHIATDRCSHFNSGTALFIQPFLQAIEEWCRCKQQTRWSSVHIVFTDEVTNGFANISSMNVRPDFLALDNTFISMKNNQCSKVALLSKTNCITVSV